MIDDVENFNEFQEVRDRTYGADIRTYGTRQQSPQETSTETRTKSSKRSSHDISSPEKTRRKRRKTHSTTNLNYDRQRIRDRTICSSIREPNIA